MSLQDEEIGFIICFRLHHTGKQNLNFKVLKISKT